MKIKPQRIQRRRSRGYDMHAESRALNGLECVSVCRPGRFGNPYSVERYGRELSMELFRNSLSTDWNPSLVKHLGEELVNETHKAHRHFLERLKGDPTEIARNELRGRNLACYCDPSVACHADQWLKLAE